MTRTGTTHEFVVPWRDPVIERIGHDALGDYVELFWLGILGPTATWLLRRFAYIAVTHPDGASVDRATLATSLGLGGEGGRTTALDRSVQRLEMFGIVRRVDDALAARTVIPPLSVRHLARLPARLQIAHSLWTENDHSPAYEALIDDRRISDEAC